jgi:hypothetical protein
MLVRRSLPALLGLVGLVAGGATVVACGGGSSDGTGGASPVATSTSGALRATLRPSSEPPPLGTQTVALDLVYLDGGAPATGLTLTVVPWMPAMEHGTSIVPTVSETTPGTYSIANAYLFMPGVWEMRTSIAATASAAADKVAPSLDVP